jgi:antitoxin MazE
MKAEIVRIGNSQGVRIPKRLLKRFPHKSIEIEETAEGLLIRPALSPRQGWEEAFRKNVGESPEGVLDQADTIENDFDRNEWEW